MQALAYKVTPFLVVVVKYLEAAWRMKKLSCLLVGETVMKAGTAWWWNVSCCCGGSITWILKLREGRQWA